MFKFKDLFLNKKVVWDLVVSWALVVSWEMLARSKR
jgi:hypothetical protein